ncbi:hypothetical protein [Streptomyces sp. NPDC048191]|uniref:hypothetical protein n=1 Tax=Streptomyces sp. NPDC048191 TaxID=3155484 RepID=UPI0033E65857
MRTARLFPAAAAAATALLAIPNTTAYAGDFGLLEVTPNPAYPGSTVNLNSSECGSNSSAIVYAQVLDAGTVRLTSRGQTHPEDVQGTLRIPNSVPPASYALGGKCANGRKLDATLEIKTRNRIP